jgi:cytochrome c oxidase subunit 1/cytochrome c oxidase subunit I+III
VAHLHYVFIGGTIFGLFAGLFYWFPKMTGRMLSEKTGKWFFWFFVLGFNLSFLVQHVLGIIGMPRRVYTYPDLPLYGTLNFISTCGALTMGFSILILTYAIVKALKKEAPAGNNPWKACTLEWATTSPPPLKNFDELPVLESIRPLWDGKNIEIKSRDGK